MKIIYRPLVPQCYWLFELSRASDWADHSHWLAVWPVLGIWDTTVGDLVGSILPGDAEHGWPMLRLTQPESKTAAEAVSEYVTELRGALCKAALMVVMYRCFPKGIRSFQQMQNNCRRLRRAYEASTFAMDDRRYWVDNEQVIGLEQRSRCAVRMTDDLCAFPVLTERVP